MSEIPKIVLVDFNGALAAGVDDRVGELLWQDYPSLRPAGTPVADSQRAIEEILSRTDFYTDVETAPMAVNGINRLRQHGVEPIAFDTHPLTAGAFEARNQWLAQHFSGPFGSWALGCCTENAKPNDVLGHISSISPTGSQPLKLTFSHAHGKAVDSMNFPDGWTDKRLLRALGMARMAYKDAIGDIVLVRISELQATA